MFTVKWFGAFVVFTLILLCQQFLVSCCRLSFLVLAEQSQTAQLNLFISGSMCSEDTEKGLGLGDNGKNLNHDLFNLLPKFRLIHHYPTFSSVYNVNFCIRMLI